MERFKSVLNIARIAVEIVLVVLLVLFLKEYRDKALSQIDEGCTA